MVCIWFLFVATEGEPCVCRFISNVCDLKREKVVESKCLGRISVSVYATVVFVCSRREEKRTKLDDRAFAPWFTPTNRKEDENHAQERISSLLHVRWLFIRIEKISEGNPLVISISNKDRKCESEHKNEVRMIQRMFVDYSLTISLFARRNAKDHSITSKI